MDFIKDILKELKDEDTHVASESTSAAEFTKYIDTGCYALNALISGSIYGGVPDTKRLMLAGESSCGKTFFALTTVKEFLNEDPSNIVIYYDSESAVTKDMFEDRDIDSKRVIIVDSNSIQKFRTHVMKFNAAFQNQKVKPKVLLVLDSLGNLSTDKELGDIMDGSDKKDMTRAGLIRGAFRAITVPLAKSKIPMIITNHTYTSMGMFPTQELSGGGGCLLPGQKILMSDGAFKNIEDVEVDDIVKTLQGEKRVYHKWTPENLPDPTPECFSVILENGDSVNCSANHKFMVNQDWVQASDLKVGDILETLNVLPLEVVSITPIGRHQVYDIAVEDAEHYILENGVVSHNSRYAADIILFISKSQDKEGQGSAAVRVGSFLTVHNYKNRFAKEKEHVKLSLRYDRGLNKYYGLLEIAERSGLIKKIGQKYLLPDGESAKESTIYKHPEKYFTKDLLDLIDLGAKELFEYGSTKTEELDGIDGDVDYSESDE